MKPKHWKRAKFSSGRPRRCWMCGCSLIESTATVDHLQARSQGGGNRQDNFRLACKPCNGSRGSRPLTPQEWARATGRTSAGRKDYSALAQAIQRARG